MGSAVRFFTSVVLRAVAPTGVTGPPPRVRAEPAASPGGDWSVTSHDAGNTASGESVPMADDPEARAHNALTALRQSLAILDDDAFLRVLSSEALTGLFKSLLDPNRVHSYPNTAEFLLDNKCRASFMASLHLSLTLSYAIRHDRPNDEPVFVSPSHNQWFDDGVMFTEGLVPFAGAIGVYRNGQLSYAIARRDAVKGEQLGPDDFEFIGLEDVRRLDSESNIDPDELKRAEPELLKLLSRSCPDEAEYQMFLERHPWVLGAQHEKFTRHDRLGEADIPDFTAVRTRDRARDIFELKQPFLQLFRQDGSFRSEFLQAWDQAERYLDFAQTNADYIQRVKGLRFDAPRCYLIIGYRLNRSQLTSVRRKQRSNSAIEILTYDDLVAQLRGTVSVLERLAAVQQSRSGE